MTLSTHRRSASIVSRIALLIVGLTLTSGAAVYARPTQPNAADRQIKTLVYIATKDGDTAKNLAQMINEGLNQVKGLLPIVAAQQPGFGPKEQKMVQDLMDTFKAVSGDGGVKLQSNISKEFIEKNAKKDQ